MRKVVPYLLMSLDGVVEEPGDWVDRFDEEMRDHLGALIAGQDAVLLGRKTYEYWVGYWPTATDEPFASFINGTHKYVASTTLRAVSWPNASVVDGELGEAVLGLKAEAGEDIGVHGSPALVRELLGLGLVDELRLAIFPVAAGKGERLLEGLDAARQLSLVDVQRTTSGIIYTTYEPKAA